MSVLLAEPPPAPHGIPHGAGFPGYFASTPPRLYPVHQQLWQSQQRMQELQRRRLAPPMHPVGGYVAHSPCSDVRSLVIIKITLPTILPDFIPASTSKQNVSKIE